MSKAKTGATFEGDLYSAAEVLEQYAQEFRNSYVCRGRWPYPHQKAEHDEIQRLAKRLRKFARLWSKSVSVMEGDIS